jgi:general secretion pathway protein M
MSGQGDEALPEGWRGQALAVALVLILAAFAWLVVVTPLVGWYQTRSAELAAQRSLLAQLSDRSTELPSLRRWLAASRSTATPPDSLLTGDSDAIAAATLQGVVQDMATGAGTTLSSEEVLPAVQLGGLRQISLRLSVSGSWPVLISLLQAIDASDLRLLVDDLELHSVADQGPGGDAAAAHPALAASFVVTAFRPGTGDRGAVDLQAQAVEPSP